MVGLLQIYILLNLLFILIKCNPRDELQIRKADQRLIQRQRQDTRDMCKIFNSETLKSSLSTTPPPLNKYDKRKKELLLKPKKESIRNKKTRRIKRAVNSVNPALNVVDDLRVESIVDKIYDDLLEKGQKIAYRRKEIPISKATTQRKTPKLYTPAHKSGRRFPFAPAVVDEEIKSTPKADFVIEEMLKPKPVRFDSAIVPYFIDAKTYDTHLADIITRAFDYFEKATCIRLQRLRERPLDPRSLQDVTWLYISNPSGIRQCVHSNEKVAIKGVQHITLGYDCMSLGDISHEIMHVLGFAHEHVRPDRDQHITILWENIKPGYKQYFEIRNDSIVEGLPYDYASVMHYPPRAFSKNGKPTIMTERDIKIGQREALSEMDLEKINIVYSNECIKRNREYLLKTCPDVVKAEVPPTNVSPQDINEYFKDKLWPYGVITYKFDTRMEFSIEEKENIKAVMDHISNQTCVQFVDINQIKDHNGHSDDEDHSSSSYHFDSNEKEDVILESNSGDPKGNDVSNNDGSYEDNNSVVPDSKFTTNDSEGKESMEDNDESPPWWNKTESSNSTEADDFFDTKELNNLVILSNSNSGDNTKDDHFDYKKGFIPDSSTSEEADPSLRFKINSNKVGDPGRTARKGVKAKDNNGAKGNYVKRNNGKHKIKEKDAIIGAKGKYTNVGGKVKTTMATRKRTVRRRRRAVPPTPTRRHAASILVLTRSDQLGCLCPPTGKPRDGSNPMLVINTDCFNTVNDLLHLFGHVLGLEHQHNMHDRDSYLHIQWDQLTEDVRHEMEPKLQPEASVGYPYDYHSIMHYPWLEIKYGKTNVMYPIWNDGWAMGHWQGLSVIDVEKIQHIYNQACLERKDLEKLNRDKDKKDQINKEKNEEQEDKDEDEKKEHNGEDEDQDNNKEDDDQENKDEDEEQENYDEDEVQENYDEDEEQEQKDEDEEHENNNEDEELDNNEEDEENEKIDEGDEQDNNEEDEEQENNDEDEKQE